MKSLILPLILGGMSLTFNPQVNELNIEVGSQRAAIFFSGSSVSAIVYRDGDSVWVWWAPTNVWEQMSGGGK